MTRVQLTMKSGNAKTGPIPVSMSERSTCPDACSFKGKDENGKLNGCYAEGGPLAINWGKVPERGMLWAEFCDAIAALPPGQLWRHNQAGDLPGSNNELDGAALLALVQANRGRRGFTYTHKPASTFTIAMANRNGFTINVSTDSLEQSDDAYGKGSPVVTVIPEFEEGERPIKVQHTPRGRKVVTCPAAYRETSCADCQLCQLADRDYIIAFPAHGIAHRKVSNMVAASALNKSKRAA